MQFVSALLLVWLSVVHGYRSGAPAFVCESMTPGHNSLPPQTQASPYTIAVAKPQTENSKVKVIISAPSGEMFAGFFVQARVNPTDVNSVGSFTQVPINAHTVNCGAGTDNGVTQADNSEKKSIEVEWEAPPDFEGSVRFVGTVVKNYTTFWTKLQSDPVQVAKRAAGEGTGISTTKGPTISAASLELQRAESALYAGCGVTKNCVGHPEGCTATRNCKAVLSITKQDGDYVVDMIGHQSKYVAIGFSDDRKMGKDNVVECVHEDDTATGIKAYRSFNTPNRKQNLRQEEQKGFTLKKGMYVDGSVYCQIIHDPVVTVKEFDFDLNKIEYHILLAAGTRLKTNNVGFHDVAYTSSENKRLMSDFKLIVPKDPFYDGCNTLKNCFGSPEGCVPSQNCAAVTAIKVEGTRYTFELKARTVGTARTPAYVAVGLSDDSKMGGDSVVECVYDGSSSVKAYLSWNRPGEKSNMRTKNQLGINFINGSYVDGVLYCMFTRDPKSSVEGKTFDLINDKYHILVAAGSSLKADGVGFHDLVWTASGEKRPLSDIGAFSESSKLLLRLHGAFMVTAWIGTASLGIVLARYYKQTWVTSSLCAKDLWFAWHRFFMLLTWTLTVVAFVLIFVEIGEWVSGNSQVHAILGCITTLLCFIQPFMAAFRPHPNTRNRPLFNWAHWLVGNSAHILAIVTIFFAVQLNKAELPDWMDWVLVGYVAFYAAVHLILSFSGCLSDNHTGKRVNSFPMKDMNTSRSPLNNIDRKQDAPYAPFRKCMLLIHILGVVAITVALVIFVVLAPIDRSWTNIQNKVKSV